MEAVVSLNPFGIGNRFHSCPSQLWSSVQCQQKDLGVATQAKGVCMVLLEPWGNVKGWVDGSHRRQKYPSPLEIVTSASWKWPSSSQLWLEWGQDSNVAWEVRSLPLSVLFQWKTPVFIEETLRNRNFTPCQPCQVRENPSHFPKVRHLLKWKIC